MSNNITLDALRANSRLQMFQNHDNVSKVDYSSEEDRIKSFVTWPVNFPVDPVRLAKSGFYYYGNGDEVICFSCHGRIKNWNYGDIVQKKHSSMYPNCDFVNGKSNNIPLKQRQKKECSASINLAEILQSINYTLMQSLEERLKTFRNKWPVKNIDILKLAEAGFFYIGYEDKVQCPFCKGIISHWELDDDPLEEHKRHFPWCSFLLNVSKLHSLEMLPWFQTNSEEDLCGNMHEFVDKQSTKYNILTNKDQEHIDLKKLGVYPYNSPAHPQQASLSARLRSFISWPSTAPVSKEDLAKAGFFYIGIGDLTKCFHCNGGLSNWEAGDNPWVEHARWFWNCAFLRLNKGEEFVETCFKENISKNIRENSPERASAYYCTEPLMDKVDEAMKSDMVKYVIDSGLFPHYIVRVAVLHQIQKTGSSFPDMNELCSAVAYLKKKMERSTLNNEKSLDLKNLDIRKCSISDSSTSTNQVENLNSNTAVILDREVKLEDKNIVDKNKKSPEDHCLCKICMDKEVGVVFLPCGHLLACTECAAAMELCPMCRKPIQATIRAYLP